MSSPLVVRDLVKTYQLPDRTSLKAVNQISFEVKAGECFGLLGPNGAGKSTSMNCISGFYPASSGSVEILGVDVFKDPKKARQNLGICPQLDNLDTDFNVLDQMERFGTYFGLPLEESRNRSKALLKKFNLEDKSNQLVETLSGGMRRRLLVARALISEPEVLILDEPTTGLDPEARRSLWSVILECRKKGKAVLLSTHYMEEAARLCDRVAILHKGKILDCQDPDRLVSQHIGQKSIEEEVRPGVVWNRPPNLEDVYLKLTGESLGGDS